MFDRKSEARKYVKRLKESGKIKNYRVIKQGKLYFAYEYR